MDKKISEEAFLKALDEVVQERPDFVYKRPEHIGEEVSHVCLYVHDAPEGGEPVPGCMMGAALHRAGVPLAELRPYEGEGIDRFLHELVDIDRFGPIAHLVERAQEKQDEGHTWDDALTEGKRYAEEGDE